MLTVSDIVVPDVEELKKLADRGHENGYLTMQEIAQELYEQDIAEEHIKDFYTYLVEHDIELIDAGDARSDGAFGADDKEKEKKAAPVPAPALDLTVDPSLDSLRLYLREIGKVPLLTAEEEVSLAFEKQIRDVVQVNEPIELRRRHFVITTDFVAEQSRRLLQVMHQLCVLRLKLRGVMIDDHPVRPIQSRLEAQVRHPRGRLPQIPLPPRVVVMRLQPDIHIKELPREPLQQNTGDQTIEIALMREDDLRFGQRNHERSLRFARGSRQT